jgi:hypothetical protein
MTTDFAVGFHLFLHSSLEILSFGKNKAGSVASGCAYLANNCASFGEAPLGCES